MALTREDKAQLIQEYSDKLGRSQVAIWSQFGGVSVAQMTQLRRQAQSAGSEVVVVKNSLIRKALEAGGLPYDAEMMAGPRIVTFVYNDVAQGTKVLTEFSRVSQERVRIVGGIVGGRLADAQQVASLTDLPSREVLLARVLGGVQAPISGLVGVLSSVLRGLINVVNARVQQLEPSDS